jgi:hypothetical protein
MTDARLPGHWLHDPTLDGLSDRAWRTYTGSLMWSAEHGTDGYLPPRAMRLLHPDGVDAATKAELTAAGRWEVAPADAYRVTGWPKHQSLAADVEWQRERNRRKVADYRTRERAKADKTTPVTGDVTGHVTDDTGGEARQGAAIGTNHAGTNAHARANNCAVDGCNQPARHGCRTCWPHAREEQTA